MSLYLPAIIPRSSLVDSSRRPAPPKSEIMRPDLCGWTDEKTFSNASGV